MPEDNKPQEGFPDVAAANEETIRKLEAQGPETRGAKPEELQDSGDALDALAKDMVEKKETPAPESEEVTEQVTEQVTPQVEKADDAQADEEAARVKAEADRTKAEEYFKDSPKLPAGASVKSSDAFSAVKIKAAQEIAAREQQLEEFKQKLADAEAKLQAGPDPEVLKELEDHRAWRAKLDVDADPKFKEFDKAVSSSQEFIYAQLLKSPAITKETIDQIKKYGGPENVNLEKIFAAVKDPTLQRLVEAKISDIEMAKFNKEQAVKTAKENITQYVAEQQKNYETNVTAHNTATQKEFSGLTNKLPWYTEKPVDPKADEPTRKAATEHNKFVADTKAQLDQALRDDSPQMRAIMLAGMAQLLYLQRVREGEKTRTTALEKELADANAKLAKFNNAAGAGRLRETGAPPGAPAPKPRSEKDNFTMTAGESLDNLARQVMEERARKNVS